MTHAPPSLHELFEFVPDGQSRPPNGPGMYTWMLRRELSRRNLSRLHAPALADGSRASLVLFPEDVPAAIAASLIEHLQEDPPALAGTTHLSIGHYFEGHWTRGERDWSPRSWVLALAAADEATLFEAARRALELAACDFLLVRSAHRDAVCLLEVPSAGENTKGHAAALPCWPFSRRAPVWREGQRAVAPLPAVRAFDIDAVAPFCGTSVDHHASLRHAHWQQLVRVFRAICPSLTEDDLQALNTRGGRLLAGPAVVDLLIAVRALLQRRCESNPVIPVDGVLFHPDSEPWFWGALLRIHTLLCHGNGLAVR